jgi:hypothetical protein
MPPSSSSRYQHLIRLRDRLGNNLLTLSVEQRSQKAVIHHEGSRTIITTLAPKRGKARLDDGLELCHIASLAFLCGLQQGRKDARKAKAKVTRRKLAAPAKPPSGKAGKARAQ